MTVTELGGQRSKFDGSKICGHNHRPFIVTAYKDYSRGEWKVEFHIPEMVS
jgi:hypothetical protein